MANDMVQEIAFTNAKWEKASAPTHSNTFTTCSFTEPGLLDETIEVVKEKVWSFRNAWKGVAEVFCRIGVSPTVLGYSSVPLHEDGYVKEHSEDVLALAKVDAGEDKPPLKRPAHLLRSLSDCSVPEDDNLLLQEDEHEDDVDHGFAESARKELVERKYLTRAAG